MPTVPPAWSPCWRPPSAGPGFTGALLPMRFNNLQPRSWTPTACPAHWALPSSRALLSGVFLCPEVTRDQAWRSCPFGWAPFTAPGNIRIRGDPCRVRMGIGLVQPCHLTDGKTESQHPNLLCNLTPTFSTPKLVSCKPASPAYSLCCWSLPVWKQGHLFQMWTYSSELLLTRKCSPAC